MRLLFENNGFFISNAKTQMSNECQRTKSKNVISLKFKIGIPCALHDDELQNGLEHGVSC
jgi:hypothetical protein